MDFKMIHVDFLDNIETCHFINTCIQTVLSILRGQDSKFKIFFVKGLQPETTNGTGRTKVSQFYEDKTLKILKKAKVSPT